MTSHSSLRSIVFWKVGRVIDRAGLEIRYTLFGYRGFESLTFRRTDKESYKGSPFLFVLKKKDINKRNLNYFL